MFVKPHEARMIEEFHELAGRIDRLEKFMGSPLPAGVDRPEYERLVRQLRGMREYRDALGDRIRAVIIGWTGTDPGLIRMELP